MRRRFRHLARSRRVRAGTLAAAGLVTMASCCGAMLAKYTVAGMNPAYIAHVESADPLPRRTAADWMAEEAFRATERDVARAGFADPWKPEPAEAAYRSVAP